MAKPRFVHDCDRPDCCTFVGHTMRYDVYRTRGNSDREPGIIMRWGNSGPEYSSLPTLGLAKTIPDAEWFHGVQLVENHG